jgi:hypothetical protein
VNAQEVVYTESFETDGVNTRYSGSPQFYDNVNDYWGRFNGSMQCADTSATDCVSYQNDEFESKPYLSDGNGRYRLLIQNASDGTKQKFTNFDGNFLWAAEDLDDNDGDMLSEKTLTLGPIDISGKTSLQFAASFASNGREYYDDDDFIKVSASIDNVSFVNILCFKAKQYKIDGASATDNKLIGLHEPNPTDSYSCNGYADESPFVGLTPSLREFTVNLDTYFPSQFPASVLYIKIEVHLPEGYEEIAFDNIRIIAPVVCIGEGTLIHTDSGEVKIEDLTPKHTVDGAYVKDLTKQYISTSAEEQGVVRIAENALGPGTPNRSTFLTDYHMVYHPNYNEGKGVQASQMVNGGTIQFVAYNGHVYNILFDKYRHIRGHGLTVGTLPPAHLKQFESDLVFGPKHRGRFVAS